MTPAEILALWRSDVVDIEPPYLWSPSEAWGYLNSAYVTFWRLVGGIADFTSPVCEVPIVSGEPTSQISPEILRIMSARRRSDGAEVKLINSTDLGRLRVSDYGATRALSLGATRGAVDYAVLGMGENLIRWINVPDSDDIADLVVFRKPLDRITPNSLEFSELHPDHHLSLLDWMKHLAYGKQDAETFDKGRSDEFGAKFEAYCAQVRRERERAKYKPRIVQYGGI